MVANETSPVAEQVAIATARDALTAALSTAGPRQHELAADLALRLARLGHATRVGFTIAPTLEAASAVQTWLSELGTQQTRTAIAPSDEAQAREGALAAPPAQAAQEAAGTEEAADEARSEKGAGVICGTPSVIPSGIVAEIRDALASERLSFRALRARIGRGWGPTRLALQALIDAGEVAREGDRGRGVRFLLRHALGSGEPAPSGSPLPDADTWGLDVPSVWGEGPDALAPPRKTGTAA